RGVGIKDGKYTIIRDEIETLDKITKVRWNMVTFSAVELGIKEDTLTDNGKTLYLKVQGPDNIQMLTWSTAPTNNYDAENPGTIIVGFECEIPANSSDAIEVLLVPKPVESEATFLDMTLDEW
ncbi:MAG: heparinase, partial [Cyclobacteriaceae bacterium]|nr:heparinase [Cyclobacteriaceae bacterium]